MKVKVKVKSLSHVRLFVTPWTVVYQAPPSMGFSRQEYWSGLPFPSSGDLPMNLGLPHCRQMLYRLSHQRSQLKRKLGLILMGGAMLSKSLIQFSADRQGCVPFLLFDLKPNYGGGNEDNGHLLQKFPYMFCYT